ncbi:hypothetical protein DICPUDRAFT_57996 [Dictyostelium purpureum]|uniref:Uncharacterized protein n=1 Tax=Dictyostelium purpureum TaxID=5786 RepID=F0ZYJ9_DICPU|nr:uncharacterized protein DICPUDRAFT_57996 [Dictyostelium purpureum]EGC30985.1 hypothetical protein DICPUDRAFT_57996 [Dictyostelium purpureum]|eukprot:XP_003292486.1 hypothetical protein DICPUDRAFT_57996 [Dictyostelium purpureum]
MYSLGEENILKNYINKTNSITIVKKENQKEEYQKSNNNNNNNNNNNKENEGIYEIVSTKNEQLKCIPHYPRQMESYNKFNETYIFLFCGDDHNNINTLYGFNINSKKIEKFNFKNNLQKEFGTFRGSLFSISSTNDSIYILNGNKYLRYDINSQNTFLISNKSMMDSSMYKSSFFDGKENIYIVGGLLNGALQENIYQWNIRTNEFIKYAKTNGPVLESQLCYSPKEDCLYMLGGWISEHDYNQTIDVFNIKERTVTTIYKFNNKETLFSHSCYVPNNHSLYIYKWKINQFYRFDIKTKTIYPLPGCIKKTNFSRLLFDYKDSIYLPSNSSIYEYKCSLNKWFEHDLNIEHKYLYTCHRI